ncbi:MULTISPECIES: FUSC family protein [Streptomyces]|uniref:FUSC family protein n=2 Tax=Streptomyces nigrescens TaxID=1920 RepID=A0A640TB05_STRNI|nr:MULTISPECIES: FUSC family protein [Streptomyces]WAT95648.1 FUSC family protein [Streptomyces libani subsp. libani]WAU03271.1 FUSC family protein [Streptomyces nigrescens]WDT58729.1 FUSC family protein [Streptomyces sp. G7(2002)]GFE20907.1 FUSC family protein [Streptomyces libani subsp. libani]GGV88425.1 FUSC family protein [Streptomyces libani subsp. libani]
MLRAPRAVPAWLAHPFHWQRLPVPWAAVARGALCAGPLLGAGIATGHPAPGVLAGLGSMLAGVNDRPGTRRTGIVHIGLPALASALGMLIGASLRAADAGWWIVPALFAVGFVSGAGSVAGPVRSNAGMQMLATTILGAGMPLPGAPWAKALYVLAGCLWLLLLRLVLRSPRPAGGALSGERAAVATVFDALADALSAVGGPGAEPARRRLTAALDRADEALRLRRLTSRLLRGPARTEERLLTERFAAATALCEASVALLWEARPLPSRVAESPRRFADALRTGRPPGRLSAPETSTAARGAFDQALLDAAVAFARREPEAPPRAEPAPSGHPVWAARPVAVVRGALGAVGGRTRRGRGLFGPAGRDYGLRVAVCIAASAAVALLLRADHWYWLPATVTFLVKPDLGPLFSRTVNRFAGTVAGVLVFAGAGLLLTGSWWPALMAGAGGALLPFATRHFALQTVAITLMVLSFVHVSGDPQAAAERIVDTSIACGIVLVVGHLPRLADPRRRVGHRVTSALRCTEQFLRYVLESEPGADPTRRLALRRTAYRALGEARAAAETAAAELLAARDRNPDWLTVVTAAERIVDAATACAVRLDHGAHRPGRAEAEALCQALSAMADALEDPDRPPGRGLSGPDLPPVPDCATLTDVAVELERIRGYAGTG